MRPRTADPSVPRRLRILLARTFAVIAISVLAGACAPIVVTDGTARGEVQITARPSNGMLVVDVSESRPRQGVEVRPDGGRTFRIPPGHYPPPGQCRIWRPGVPPGQQEAPGSCSDLERRVGPGDYLVRG